MSTPLQRLAGSGFVPEAWPHASSFEDLASLQQELRKIEEMEQGFTHNQSNLQSREELEEWPVAAYHLNRQREALHSRAWWLSHGKVKATKLTDLSAELLAMIFRNFQYSSPLDGTFDKEVVPRFPEEDRQTVRSLRLVSRRFNDLASPLLCPVVRLVLDQGSLNRVNSISANPLLASGVRAFSIGLEHRPTLLARDIRAWLARYGDGPMSSLLSSEIAQNTYRRNNVPYVDPKQKASLLEESIFLREAGHRAKLFKAASRQLRGLEYNAGATSSEELDEADIARYKELLRAGHAAFVSNYEDQARLIAGGSFAKAIGRLAAKTSRPVALEFFERCWSLPRRGRNQSRTVFRSESLLQSVLAVDVGWPMMDYAERNVREEIPVSLMADLPLEIHNAGGVLGGYQLHCPPLPHHIEVFFNPGMATEAWLNKSFQHLKILRIARYIEDEDRWNLISAPRKSIYEWFFTALLSAPRLNEVVVEGVMFTSFLRRLKLPGSVLNSLSSVPLIFNSASPLPKSMRLSSIVPSQVRIEVDGLKRDLGIVDSGDLDEASSKDVDLRMGMELLREKLSRSRSPGSPEGDSPFYLNRVSEGERSLVDEDRELWMELAAYMEGERLNGNPVWMWTVTY